MPELPDSLDPPEFHRLIESCQLPSHAWQALNEVGFAVIPGPLAASRLSQLAEAYDRSRGCQGRELDHAG